MKYPNTSRWTWVALASVLLGACASGSSSEETLGDVTQAIDGAVCNSVRLTAPPGLPPAPNTPVTVTATATCTSSTVNPEFLFFWTADGSGTLNQIGTWQQSPVLTWTPQNLPSARYRVVAYARAQGSQATYESTGFVYFNIGNTCYQTALSAPLSASVVPGTTTRLTANASCTGNVTAEYKYEYKTTGSASTNLLRTWGPAIYDWPTGGLAPGSYVITVSARGVNDPSRVESSTTATVQLGEVCNAVTLAQLNFLTPPPIGTQIPVSATATCTSGIASYAFNFVERGGTERAIQGWSTAPNTTWDTHGLASGVYNVNVYARRNGNTASYESTDSDRLLLGETCYQLNPQISNTTISSGSELRLNATSVCSGGSATYRYFYRVGTSAIGPMVLIRDWGEPEAIWNTDGLANGTYQIVAQVRNQANNPNNAETTAVRLATITPCPLSEPLLAIGRNGHVLPFSDASQTPRAYAQLGIVTEFAEFGKDWDNEVQASALAWGDVDGDGRDELILGRSNHEGYRLYVQDDFEHNMAGLGAVFDGWGSNFGVTAIATGDIDGDGLDEIAVGRQQNDGNELFLLDDQKTGFATIKEFDLGGRDVKDLAFGDADNDGRLELLVARSGRDAQVGRVFVVEDSTENYRTHAFAEWSDTQRDATAIAIGDLEGDGIKEIVVGHGAGSGPRTTVYHFDSSVNDYVAIADFNQDWGNSRYPTAIKMGDLDGDGNDEVVVGRNGCSGCDQSPKVYVYDLPIVNGALTTLTSLDSEWGADRGVQSLALGDIDGDGRMEIIEGRTPTEGPRVVVHDDALSGFSWMEDLGDGWGSDRSTTALAVSKQRICMNRTPAAVPDTAAESDNGFAARQASVVRRVVDQFLPTLVAGAMGGESSGEFARRLFGEFTKDSDKDTPLRRILAGGAAIELGLPEAQSLLAAGFPQLMNQYIVENVSQVKDVGTGNDFDFNMMLLVTIAYHFEKVKLSDGTYLLSDAAIDKLFLRTDKVFLSGATEAHNLTKEVFPTIAGPETENHALMINTWSYLANQWIAGHKRGLGPVSGDPSDYVNAGSRLERFLRAATGRFLKNGSWETNARVYQAYTIRALEILYSYSEDPTMIRAAQNALDYLASKYAFQSLRGRRLPPLRRNIDHSGDMGFYISDYVAAQFGVLTGATVFDTSLDCQGWFCAYSADQPRGFALDSALLGYRIPAPIQDFMLHPDNHHTGFGAWARMQDRYTESHYVTEVPGRYPLPDALNQPDLNAQVDSGDLQLEPALELYFLTNDYENSSGAMHEHYATFDGPFATEQTSPGLDFFSKPSILIGDRDFGYFNSARGASFETLVLRGAFDPTRSFNQGVYKNFAFGYSEADEDGLRMPSNWTVAATAVLGDATIRIVDPASMSSAFTKADHFAIVGTFSGRRAFWEVVPTRLFASAQLLLQHVISANQGNNLRFNTGFEYTLAVSGEKLTLSPVYPEGPIPFIALDGDRSKIRQVHWRSDTNNLPLIDVRQVDDHYAFTGVNYVCANGDGRVIIYNPFLRQQLTLDSRDHQAPLRDIIQNVDPASNPCAGVIRP